MIKLYSADICPFAQRTRALLAHLDESFDWIEVDLRNKSEEFVRISPTGKVPLITDGDFKLYESQIINEYLAESRDWAGGWDRDPKTRARQRLAAKQFDSIVIEPFYKEMKGKEVSDEDWAKVARELDELERTVAGTDGQATMLAFHCATFWLRMDALRHLSPTLPRLVDERPALKSWLEAAIARPEIRSTAPDLDKMRSEYARYAKAG